MMPSIQPSAIPSDQPTVIPSMQPSSRPTTSPSGRPSSLPSMQPSGLPTAVPSGQPSVSPSSEPSGQPSCQPLGLPSCQPSMQPTARPTSQPSASPTELPSSHPSVQPTRRPTKQPTRQPSVQPSSGPSVCPSVVPSEQPTPQPTLQPSSQPSRMPSSQPSLVPSRQPTRAPTVQPSGQPSRQPSSAPSVLPSNQPLNEPSSQPTVTPTRVPSCGPTSQPTLQPHCDPTCQPSTQPLSRPSRWPTSQPSGVPTAGPTSQPTGQPVNNPFLNLGALPPNVSISVTGSLTTAKFKIVLPFQQVSRVTGKALSDIVPVEGRVANISLVMGGRTLTASNRVDSCSNGVSPDFNGRSVSVMPDVNDDGYDDLIIGDPFAARCYVVFGNEMRTNMSVGFTIYGESEGDLTGWSVSAAGDVNNDTMSDIIVGAPAARGVGAFYIVYGRNVTSDVYLSYLSSDIGVAVYGATRGDGLGLSVSGAGDLNKDGYDDVIVGAAMTSLFDGGAAYVVYGSESPQSMDNIVHLSRDQGYKLSGPSYSLSGYSVSGAGDVNGDSYDDVLIGSSPLRKTLVPTTYLVYGSGVKPENVLLSQLAEAQGAVFSGGGVIVGSVGDINSDGLSDVFMGSSAGFNSQSGFLITLDASACYRFSPTAAPSRRPSRPPSLVPSRRPSVVSSPFPSLPPQESNSNPTQYPTAAYPSSRPTGQPNLLTASSVEPSEAPSVRPTMGPTLRPTTESTVMPSHRPVCSPTALPSTMSPTDTSRAPFNKPTLFPTVTSSVVIDGTQNSYLRNNLTSSVFVVNATIDVTLAGQGSCGSFVVLKQPGTTFTTDYFNFSCDVIDLTYWPEYKSMQDLRIQSGSVIIRLSDDQVFKIQRASIADITAANFHFAIAVNGDGEKDAFNASIVIGLVLLSVFGLYVLVLVYPCANVGFSPAKIDLDGSRENINTSLPLCAGVFMWVERRGGAMNDDDEGGEGNCDEKSEEVDEDEKISEISFDWKQYSDGDDNVGPESFRDEDVPSRQSWLEGGGSSGVSNVSGEEVEQPQEEEEVESDEQSEISLISFSDEGEQVRKGRGKSRRSSELSVETDKFEIIISRGSEQ